MGGLRMCKTCKICDWCEPPRAIEKIDPFCGHLKITVSAHFYCTDFKSKFKPSFQKITILYGKQKSGKSFEAIQITGKRKTLFIDHNGMPRNLKEIKNENFDIVIFDSVLNFKEIKKIMKLNLPVKEIIICIQKS